MSRLIFRWILLLLPLCLLLIAASKFTGTAFPSPLLTGIDDTGAVTTLHVMDMRSSIPVSLRFNHYYVRLSGDNCHAAASRETSSSAFTTLNLADGQRAVYPMPGMTGVDRLWRLIAWSPDNRWLAVQYSHNGPDPLAVIDTLTDERVLIDEDFSGLWRGWMDTQHFQIQASTSIYTYDMAARAFQPHVISSAPWYRSWNALYLLPDGDASRLLDAATGAALYRFSNINTATGANRINIEPAPNHASLAFTEINSDHDRQTPVIYHLATGTRLELPPLNTSYQPALIWSPDSTKLAYQQATPQLNRRDDILVIDSATGEVLHRVPQLTIVETVWSPDSRYLVMRGVDLRILDTHSGQVTAWDYPASGFMSRILWSPDSAWFGIRLFNRQSDSADMFILSIANGQIEATSDYRGSPGYTGFCFPE
jgi:hypothetical protein